jgi:pimeloyl-ACP methyl ester carboxylesterase
MIGRMGPVVLDPHAEVRGVDVAQVEVRGDDGAWVGARWADLDVSVRTPGDVQVRVHVDGGASGADVQVPPCAGRKGVTLDGQKVAAPPGPVVTHVSAGPHDVVLAITVSAYERRVACGQPVRVGTSAKTLEGIGVLSFESPHGAAGGGKAVVVVPPGHDRSRPAVVLVGLHPWNGTMWTYASYSQLLGEAAAKDVVVLLPSGLGNSLYTADAEDEAMRALDALASVVAVDGRRVSIWGASMGGAGATTVGLHHPDRFASITSYFGDSQYDLTTYVKGLLHDEAGAHAVNALDVVDNARWVPVWLVHGEADRSSPIKQSEMLADALQARTFAVRFDRVPGMGHQGALVAKFLTAVVDRAAAAQVPAGPPHVTYRSVRPWDTGAYGVHLTRASATGDAFVDVERQADGVHVLKADEVRAVTLDPGALGTDTAHAVSITNDTGHSLDARWADGGH